MKISQQEVNRIIQNFLLQGQASLTVDAQVELETFIYQRLTSKKFRKTKMDEACAERTKKAINLSVANNEALKVIYPQGGYKLWRFPSSPQADWAEFFNISYLIEYLLPIATLYKPGIELVYYMHTLLMELHDNLTTEEIQAYVDSFQRLIDEFSKHLPQNLKITILRDADLYSREEFFKKLEDGKVKAEVEYQKWDEAKKQDFIRMAKLNIKWNGKENWSILSDKEKKQKLYNAALYELAATTNLDKVAEIVKSPKNILAFTKATKDFIGIGSTKTSMAKYWVGFGVLETNIKGQLMPRILTPNQYEFALSMPHEEITVSGVPGKNFTKILVFERAFNFSKGS